MSDLATMHNIELVVMGGLFLVTFASVFVYGFHGFLKVNKWVFKIYSLLVALVSAMLVAWGLYSLVRFMEAGSAMNRMHWLKSSGYSVMIGVILSMLAYMLYQGSNFYRALNKAL